MSVYLDYIPEGGKHKNPLKDRRVDFIPAPEPEKKGKKKAETVDEGQGE